MINTTSNEIKQLTQIVRLTALKDLYSLSAVNVGSAHKTKDDIVNTVCKSARDAAAFQGFLLSCMDHIADGGTIESYLHMRIDEITNSSNLCQPDKIRLREMLDRLSEHHLEI